MVLRGSYGRRNLGCQKNIFPTMKKIFFKKKIFIGIQSLLQNFFFFVGQLWGGEFSTERLKKIVLENLRLLGKKNCKSLVSREKICPLKVVAEKKKMFCNGDWILIKKTFLKKKFFIMGKIFFSHMTFWGPYGPRPEDHMVHGQNVHFYTCFFSLLSCITIRKK